MRDDCVVLIEYDVVLAQCFRAECRTDDGYRRVVVKDAEVDSVDVSLDERIICFIVFPFGEPFVAQSCLAGKAAEKL